MDKEIFFNIFNIQKQSFTTFIDKIIIKIKTLIKIKYIVLISLIYKKRKNTSKYKSKY